jgi:kinesin family protein C1
VPTPEGAGIIPRAVDLILGRVEELAAQEWEYTLEASFIEVYNNTLRWGAGRFGIRLPGQASHARPRPRCAIPPFDCRRRRALPPPTPSRSCRDLLCDGAARSADAGRITDSNAIKHDAAGGHTVVAGASRVPVAGAGHAAELVRRAADARACAETAMNSTSSRSHVVFMLYIGGHHAASGTRLTGCLCLVDLAGRCDCCAGRGRGGRRGARVQ